MDPLTQALSSKINQGSALPFPTGNSSGSAGMPGFMSSPTIPKSTLNSNEPGSLSSIVSSWNTPSSTNNQSLNVNNNVGSVSGPANANIPSGGNINPYNLSISGLSTNSNSNSGKVVGVLAPPVGTSGLATVKNAANTTASGDNIQNGIDLTKYNASMTAKGLGSNGLPTAPAVNPNTPVNSTAPGTVGNPGTNPAQNAATVLQTSEGDTAGQGAANAAALYGILGQNASLAPFAGQGTQGLDQSFANLERPQSTANQAGEEGLFNTQNAIFQNAANTSAAQAIANKQIATGGAESVLGASLPTQVAPGNTLVNPLTQESGYGLGSSGGNGSEAYQNFSNLQFNTVQGQALAKQANDLTAASNQTDQNFQTLQNAASGLNLSNYPSWNAINQTLQNETGGAGKVSALNEATNALQTSLSSIIANGTSGLTPTAITALTNNQAINTLSPSQLQTLYDTVKATVQTKIRTTQDEALSYEKGGINSVNSTSAITPSSSNSLYNF